MTAPILKKMEMAASDIILIIKYHNGNVKHQCSAPQCSSYFLVQCDFLALWTYMNLVICKAARWCQEPMFLFVHYRLH